MRRIILLSYLCIFLVFFLQSRPCIGCDKAKELYEQASSCFFTAQQEEKQSYQKAHVIYRASLSYLDRILSECPDSYQTSALKSGDLTIGHLTYSHFKNSFLPRMKLSAEGEGDFLTCARLVMESAGDSYCSFYSFMKLACHFTETGREEQVIQMLKISMDIDDKDAIKMGMIEGYLKTGRSREALELSRDIGSSIWRLNKIERCAEAFSNHNQNERVFQILSEEEDKLNKIDGKPGTLCMLAEIYHQQGYRERSLQLMDQALAMAQADKKPERALDLMGIAYAFARIGEYDLAEETVNLIDVRLRKIIRKEMRCDMAIMMIKSGQYEKALAMAMSIEDQWYRADTLKEMASSLAGSGDRVKAYAVLSQAHEVLAGFENKADTVGTHIRLAEVYKAMDDDNNASAEVTAAIAGAAKEGPQQRERSLMWVSKGCARLGYYEHASKIAEIIQIPEFKAEALVELIREIRKKDPPGALRYLPEAERNASEIRDRRNRSDIMESIACQYAYLGQVEKAEQYARAFDKDVFSWVLQAIALHYLEVGDFERALKYAMINVKRRPYILKDIAIKYAEKGDFEKALQAADKICKPHGDNGLSRNESLRSISECYIKAGNYDEALRALSRMSDKGLKAYILVDLAEIYHNNKIQPGDRTKKMLHAIILSIDNSARAFPR